MRGVDRVAGVARVAPLSIAVHVRAGKGYTVGNAATPATPPPPGHPFKDAQAGTG
jgi:hypothetical protein